MSLLAFWLKMPFSLIFLCQKVQYSLIKQNAVLYLKNPNNSNKVVQSTYFLQVNPSIMNVFYKIKNLLKKLKEKTFIMKLLSQISDILNKFTCLGNF